MTYTRIEMIEKLKMFELGWEDPKSALDDFWEQVITELDRIPKYRKKYKRWKRKALEQKPCDDAKDKLEREYLFESICEDLKKAYAEIERLKQPCEDAVNRQVVLDTISKIGLCKCSTNEIQAVDECRRAVEALPPVTQKSGEWIEDTKTYAGDHLSNYKCSLCGEIAGSWVQGLTQDKLFKFCPNCGADMRGAE